MLQLCKSCSHVRESSSHFSSHGKSNCNTLQKVFYLIRKLKYHYSYMLYNNQMQSEISPCQSNTYILQTKKAKIIANLVSGISIKKKIFFDLAFAHAENVLNQSCIFTFQDIKHALNKYHFKTSLGLQKATQERERTEPRLPPDSRHKFSQFWVR